jgi:hypothetical protein
MAALKNPGGKKLSLFSHSIHFELTVSVFVCLESINDFETLT